MITKREKIDSIIGGILLFILIGLLVVLFNLI